MPDNVGLGLVCKGFKAIRCGEHVEWFEPKIVRGEVVNRWIYQQYAGFYGGDYDAKRWDFNG